MNPGPKAEAETPDPSPLDTFQLFFTDELIDYVVEQSNLYGQQNGAAPVTRQEMKKFMGLTILTGSFFFVNSYLVHL